MANIYDTANQMASDLKASQQFQELKKAYDLLKLDAMGWALFQQFQQKQGELQQKQMAGQEITQDDMKSLQDLSTKMQNIQPIQEVMAKEQQLSNMMDELNKIISQPIIELYGGNQQSADQPADK